MSSHNYPMMSSAPVNLVWQEHQLVCSRKATQNERPRLTSLSVITYEWSASMPGMQSTHCTDSEYMHSIVHADLVNTLQQLQVCISNHYRALVPTRKRSRVIGVKLPSSPQIFISVPFYVIHSIAAKPAFRGKYLTAGRGTQMLISS